jgi:hypothetical protein
MLLKKNHLGASFEVDPVKLFRCRSGVLGAENLRVCVRGLANLSPPIWKQKII